MTLFRKVFQNQSRPAEAGETLDEDALRAAFKEMRDSRDPFVLDPFEHAAHPSTDVVDAEGAIDSLDTTNRANGIGDSDHGVGQSTEYDAPEYDGDFETIGFSDEDFEEEISALEQELSSVACTQKSAEEGAEVTTSSKQRDDDIVANLGRVLVDTPVQADASLEDENDDDRIQDDLNLCEDQNPGDIGFPSQKSSVELAEEKSFSQTSEDSEEPDPVLDSLAVQDAAALFARQQMTALESSQVAQVEEMHATEDTTPVADAAEEINLAALPAPSAGRAGRRAVRSKTRVLGFNRGEDAASDPFGATPDATATPQRETFPVGWLVIVDGPGIGHAFSLFTGASMIGRGEDQVIRLDFGDNSISRHNHAAIAYDEEQNKFYIGHGGKSNIIRRNARPVLSTEELLHADLIRIGETTMRFVALCGSDFHWNGAEGASATGV